MFDELKELMKKYPIGAEVNRKEWVHWHNEVYYTERDLIEYRRRYGTIEILDDTYCRVKDRHVECEVVAGYLYDGKKWVIVENTWDGFVPIHDEEDDNGN